MAGVFSINLDVVFDQIQAKAIKGVMAATTTAVGKAKSHAPVRKIFRGTTYKTSKAGFRQPVLRRALAGDVQRVGHANSLIPLFRTKQGGRTTFVSGDFRRVGGGEREFRFGRETYEPGTQRLAKLGSGKRTSTIGEGGVLQYGLFKATKYGRDGGTADTGEVAVFSKVKGGKLKLLDTGDQKFSGTPSLTSRGRFEVRSGRANFKGSDGVNRVGGRLRGEIHAEGPTIIDGVIWGYVVSATKDPETGHLYPRDQEFGSAHNRPHPFLRPALHESRGPLRRELREAIRRGPQ